MYNLVGFFKLLRGSLTVYCKSHIQEKKKQEKHAFRIVLVLLLRFSLQPLDIMGGLNAFEMGARWEH